MFWIFRHSVALGTRFEVFACHGNTLQAPAELWAQRSASASSQRGGCIMSISMYIAVSDMAIENSEATLRAEALIPAARHAAPPHRTLQSY